MFGGLWDLLLILLALLMMLFGQGQLPPFLLPPEGLPPIAGLPDTWPLLPIPGLPGPWPQPPDDPPTPPGDPGHGTMPPSNTPSARSATDPLDLAPAASTPYTAGSQSSRASSSGELPGLRDVVEVPPSGPQDLAAASLAAGAAISGSDGGEVANPSGLPRRPGGSQRSPWRPGARSLSPSYDSVSAGDDNPSPARRPSQGLETIAVLGLLAGAVAFARHRLVRR